MKSRKPFFVLGLIFTFFCLNLSAHAVETGKIYLNGTWVDGKVSLPKILDNKVGALMSGIAGNAIGLGMDLRKLAMQFLNENGAVLRWNSDSAWEAPSVQNGEILQTQRIAKTWQGLRVVGGEALVHFARGNLQFANADNTDLSQLSSKARISANEAKALAFASYGGAAATADAPKLEVLILNNADSREARLVYEVTVQDRDTFTSDVHYIDANRGDELMVKSNVHTLAPRAVMVAAGDDTDFDFDEAKWKPALTGDKSNCSPIRTFGPQDGSPVACETLDPKTLASATAAWNNSGLVHDFYQSVFKRNSIDNKGMQIKSVVNFGGQKFGNAAWYDNKKIMLYGTGDSTKYNDFALPLDVAGHEMTHGITASTAALEYSAEPGALNESYSDVFGKLIAFKNGKASDWKIGRDLFVNGVGFVRDMENPDISNTANFRYRGQVCHRLNDFCGVHSNSGIPNRAAVLIAKKLGLEKLGKIYYLTLTQLLRSNSSFADARAQTEAACSTLYGASAEDCRTVSAAFQSVGI